MSASTDFKLPATERHTHTWQLVKAHLEHRLSVLREQNDWEATPESTAKTRGRIAEIKLLLSAGVEAAPIDTN